jgi:hypothetical protein
VSPLSTVQGATADTVTMPIVEDINNKKFVAGFIIDTAYADVVAIFELQASYDGVTYFTLTSIAADMTPNATGTYQYLVDNTNIYAPYYRLMANRSGLNLGTTGKMKLLYCV